MLRGTFVFNSYFYIAHFLRGHSIKTAEDELVLNDGLAWCGLSLPPGAVQLAHALRDRVIIGHFVSN